MPRAKHRATNMAEIDICAMDSQVKSKAHSACIENNQNVKDK